MKNMIYSAAMAAFFVPAANAQSIGTGNNFNDATDEIGIARNGTLEGYATGSSLLAYIQDNITFPDDASIDGAAVNGDQIDFTDGGVVVFSISADDLVAAIGGDAAATTALNALINHPVDPDIDTTNELGALTISNGVVSYDPDGPGPLPAQTAPLPADLNTTNTTLGTTASDLVLTDSDGNTVSVSAADLVALLNIDPDDTTQTFEITDFSIAGNSIEIAATGDDGGDDTATLPMATIDECGVATDPSHPVSAAQVRNFVEGERQAWRAGLEYPPDIWDDAALQTLPVGVRVAGTTMTFEWTNPSACESAVVFLAARVGNTEFLNIADGNAIRVFYEQVGMNGDTIAEYDTQGQMPGSVTTSLNGSSFERRTATVAPGATITVSITPTIELKVPYNPQPNAEVSTRRVSYALLAVRVY